MINKQLCENRQILKYTKLICHNAQSQVVKNQYINKNIAILNKNSYVLLYIKQKIYNSQ